MTNTVTQKTVNAWCWAGWEEKVVEVRIASSSGCDLARAHRQKKKVTWASGGISRPGRGAKGKTTRENEGAGCGD